MGIIKKSKVLLKYGTIGYIAHKILRDTDILWRNLGSDKSVTRRKYKKVFGHFPDLDNPQKLTEKIQWIKLNDRIKEKTILADKYLVRDYLVQRFGDKVVPHLVPLLFVTSDWREITLKNIPDTPFIVKSNHSSAQNRIIYDLKEVDIRFLRQECRLWLSTNYYLQSQEYQYRDIPRKIVFEKLLQTKDGHIPNDYKLHYFNGKLEFVYCSIGRETINTRRIYDADWNPLMFRWDKPFYKLENDSRGEEIPPPPSFELMKYYAEQIAQDYDYVRVDFYDVDGFMYFGEVTFHHGGGFNTFCPSCYDEIYGKKLSIRQHNK